MKPPKQYRIRFEEDTDNTCSNCGVKIPEEWSMCDPCEWDWIMKCIEWQIKNNK